MFFFWGGGVLSSHLILQGFSLQSSYPLGFFFVNYLDFQPQINNYPFSLSVQSHCLFPNQFLLIPPPLPHMPLGCLWVLFVESISSFQIFLWLCRFCIILDLHPKLRQRQFITVGIPHPQGILAQSSHFSIAIVLKYSMYIFTITADNGNPIAKLSSCWYVRTSVGSMLFANRMSTFLSSYLSGPLTLSSQAKQTRNS